MLSVVVVIDLTAFWVTEEDLLRLECAELLGAGLVEATTGARVVGHVLEAGNDIRGHIWR